MVMSIAAVCIMPDRPHLRIYSSDGVNITEKCWSDGWVDGIFKAPGQSVSATTWFDGSVHVRVYAVNAGVTTEWCWDADGPWYKGAYPG